MKVKILCLFEYLEVVLFCMHHSSLVAKISFLELQTTISTPKWLLAEKKTSHSHFQGHVKRFMWILQNSDMVEVRPILGVTSRSTVLETKRIPSSFKLVWRAQNGIKDQILNLSWQFDINLHGLFEFRSNAAHIYFSCFRPKFQDQNDSKR